EKNQFLDDHLAFAFGFLIMYVIFVPLFIYLFFGVEPKINYDEYFERELPTQDSPVFVNALRSNSGKTVGKPDIKGFEATIMDLIARKVILIESEKIKDENKGFFDFGDEYNVNLIISSEENLKNYEMELIKILKNYSFESKISLNKLRDTLGDNGEASKFINALDDWFDNTQKELFPEDSLSKYFNNTGQLLFAAFIVGLFIYIIILLFCVFPFERWDYWILIAIAIILIRVGMKVPDDVFGQWTPYGREFHLKWENFRKYLNTNSLLKDYPPESVVVWEEYLVYATALGVADKVYEYLEMEKIIDSYLFKRSVFYSLYLCGGFILLDSCLKIVEKSSSGSGGSGGSSGGGGGGAF
ncbi:MAG: DUF2207 domain-containing protein, partial [Methanobrevibacter sp.]|nr:DUF2207 domain-containing protein [Methanobrevibacter sp.]